MPGATVEQDETFKIDRVARPSVSRHVVFMTTVGLAGWLTLLAGSVGASWSTGAHPATPSAWAAFLAIVVAIRAMAFRALAGATDPLKAAPGTIRGDNALEVGENIVHGSDSPESAAREIKIFFPDLA